MTNFGSLGGRPGGFGASYPTRSGPAPFSQNVLSDQEFHDGWQRRLAMESPLLMDTVQLNPGAENYNAGTAKPYLAEIAETNKNYVASQLGVDRNAEWARGFFDSFDALKGTQYDAGAAPSASGGHSIFVRDYDNPAFLDAQRQYQSEQDQRADAQARNQQAYNSMLGGNQINGILGANYSQPAFGQIGASQPSANPGSSDGLDLSLGGDVFRPGDTYAAPRATPRGWGFR